MSSIKVSWKRKVGNVKASTASVFTTNTEYSIKVTEEIDDWRSLLPHKKHMLEDNITKSDRLMQEGITMAEEERYWEAVNKFDEAAAYTPNNEKLFEMKSQALLELSEVFPAVQAAQRAVQINPLWSEAFQTLGRAQLGIGDVDMALKSFCRAYHLNPCLNKIYSGDILWTLDLVSQKKLLEQKKESSSGSCCVCSKELKHGANSVSGSSEIE